MKEWTVEVEETALRTYCVDVEAENEEEAEKQAKAIIDEGDADICNEEATGWGEISVEEK